MATVTPSTRIAGVVHVELTTFGDERGSFTETYRREWVPGAREMIQSNRGDRKAGCVVGLHYHLHQADYWYVPFGTARAVLHDLRVGSPTDGATEVVDLGESGGSDATPQRGLYIPPGVAHGFASLTDMTITYLVDGYYNPSDELGVAWNDPEIGADWGLIDPVVSARDAANVTRSALAPHAVPRWPLRT
ncbi:MAG: dTDP-4-dehydrorhamnose 3,5-epimerase family protein [Acidimicrobiales bacterium]